MKTSVILALFVAIPLASATNITVSVGKDETTGKKGFGFAPSYIYPNIGDLILFEFESGSHSVVESSFATPCTPNGGFDSQVQKVPDSTDLGAPGLPTIDYYVNSTDTLWFSDQAGDNCKQGAVFVVNPTLAQTAAQFKANAMANALPSNTTSIPHHNVSTSIQTPSGLGITAVICRSFCSDNCDKTCFYVDLSQKYPDGST
ncbi:hypothetical protein IW261DRAFT_96427 [Armillaria novae-zelandiae]|uniref:Uncharacterized protein n=1 Tax=Armillaria novae-zelandiae TaxID=153914 RepID=A0AA39UPB7_9AGAR|nr:hypothetical protein IW261DRAFT_96427 [Armillaria novae-zelandiae]